MEEKIFELFKKNIENFDNILDGFFQKKELTIYNYFPEEYLKLESALEDNFKKLKDILDKNKNFVKILEYTKEKKEKVQDSIENCFESIKFDILCLKKEHYTNLLKFLEEENSDLNFEKMSEDFFGNFESDIFEYFRKKRKIFDEKDI